MHKNTKDFYYEDHFNMTYKRMLNATHWIDEEGEQHKLTHALKAVYHHKLDQYRSFSKAGLLYKEGHRRVADTLGIDYDMVRKFYIPLLKRMGLIEIIVHSPRNAITTMYDLKYLKGALINDKLKDKNKLKPKKNKDTMTHEQYKIVLKNKQKIERMNKDLKTEYFILTKQDMDNLRNTSKGGDNSKS